MFSLSLKAVATAVTLILAMNSSLADTAAPVKVVMTDSSTAPLAATKRVVISSVMVSFQASTGGEKTNTSGLFATKTDASAQLQMPEMDNKLLASIADEVYKRLTADLQATGFEVLPESTVVGSAAYAKIIKMAGISNFSKFANLDGDTVLVGPSGLKPYLPYNLETGKFNAQMKSLIKDWIGGFGQRSSTEGGPSGISIGEIYGLPALEVELAKELNAHVVKATYVVTLGSASATAKSSYAGNNRALGTTSFTNTYTGKAFAQVGLLAGQSRIAFRTAGASTKGESPPGGYVANFGKNASPAKDGNVVASLAESLLGGSEFLSVAVPEVKQPSLLGGLMGGSFGSGADAQFIYLATVSDPDAYRQEVLGMITTAQRDMLALVKQ